MRQKWILGVFVTITALIYSSELLRGQSNFFKKADVLKADHAIFKYDSSQVYWEIYYALNQSQLNYVQNDAGKLASLVLLQLQVYKDDTLWASRGWKTQNVIEDTTQLSQAVDLLDRVDLLVPEGNFSVTLKAQDLNNPSLADSVKFVALVTPFSPDTVSLSDVELASSIERKSVDKTSPFYKNTLMVIPNPKRLFGAQTERLYFYLESYYLLTSVPGDNYNIKYYVADLVGKSVEQISPVQQIRKKQYDSRVEFGSLNIGSLALGTYFFHFDLSDSAGNILASRSKKFFIYKPDTGLGGPTLAQNLDARILQSEFGTLSEAELEQEYKYVGYIMTSEHKQNYEALNTVNAKRRFLYLLWKAYDPKPKTLLNEFRREYMERVKYANENFETLKREGWHSDRGRVYIIYGKPTYVENHPNEENTKPYEVWNYDQIQGGVLFVFGDLTGFRNYELIHSTARGETHNAAYMQILRGGYGY